MARPLRVEYPDAIYHVTSRGNGRQEIVLDDADRDRWMRVLDRVVTGYRWRIFSFVLMDNHYHLFLQTPEANLSKGMQEINGGYAAYFNARHSRPGHLFQGRFKALVVEEEGHWDVLSRYIHLNPVRAGMAPRPEDWAWSSFRGYDRVNARELPQLNLLRPCPSVTQVTQAVAAHYKVDASRWRCGCRDNGLSRAMAVYIARQVTRESLSAIGKIMGYRHVSGIRAAGQRAEKAMENKRTAKEVNNLIQKIA